MRRTRLGQGYKTMQVHVIVSIVVWTDQKDEYIGTMTNGTGPGQRSGWVGWGGGSPDTIRGLSV